MRPLALSVVIIGSGILSCGGRTAASLGNPLNADEGAPGTAIADASAAAEGGATFDGGSSVLGSNTDICNGGCECYSANDCPLGADCYLSQTERPDGSVSDLACTMGIVDCARGGKAWSVGNAVNNCPLGERPISADAGPSGAFCCTR
jgi:hypothetical protein